MLSVERRGCPLNLVWLGYGEWTSNVRSLEEGHMWYAQMVGVKYHLCYVTLTAKGSRVGRKEVCVTRKILSRGKLQECSTCLLLCDYDMMEVRKF